MNPKIQRDWAAALRSGEYRQGQGTLRSPDDEFCCLGVLCDLAVKAGIEVPVSRSNAYDYDLEDVRENEGNYLYDDEDNFLPIVVREWAGIGSADPRLGNEGTYGDRQTASALNDTGYSFHDIAQLIEQGVE